MTRQVPALTALYQRLNFKIKMVNGQIVLENMYV